MPNHAPGCLYKYTVRFDTNATSRAGGVTGYRHRIIDATLLMVILINTNSKLRLSSKL
jgi:hypothetical protein